MFISAESRWFWRESLPAGLEDWFRSTGFSPGGGIVRIDEYLLDAGNPELGVKKRGGKNGVEIKGLVETRSALPAPFHGRVQIWSKWSSEAVTIDALPRLTLRKTRSVRKFDAAAPEVRELAVGPDEQLLHATELTDGCQAELTSLIVGDNNVRWWTFGFEAFGSLQTVERSLRRIVDHLLRTSPPTLEAATELSYPQWIASRPLG